jgi:V/A-type H+-transporting ATPase subunit C
VSRAVAFGAPGRDVAGVSGFEYGNTRLRARRSRLFGESDYRELFLAGTTERMLGVLRTTAYGLDVERALVHHHPMRRLDGAVSGHLVRTLGDLRRFYTGRAAEGIELLVGRWDLRNLLAIVRSKAHPAAGTELDSMLVPAGLLGAPALAELAAQSSLRSVIDLMVAWDLPSRSTARRLLREWPRFETEGDPSVFEDALTRAWAESVDDSLSDWNGTALEAVLRAEVDHVNLLASLRRRDVRVVGPADDDAYLPGGALGEGVLARVRQAPTADDAIAALSAQSLAPMWMEALHTWNDDQDLSALGGRIERAIARAAIGLFASGDPLGIAIPVAFVWAKESEARNVRLVGRALAHRFDWPDIEQELFPW